MRALVQVADSPKSVACGHCGALPGFSCVDPKMSPLLLVHARRVDAYRYLIRYGDVKR